MNNDKDIPAFPSHGSMGEVVNHGMTLRDYFAAVALQGAASCWQTHEAISSGRASLGQLAEASYLVADAMLEARKA